MITCNPGGDPRTARTLRGCTIVIVALAVVLVLACICAAIPSVNAAPVEQATLTPTARASVVICQSIGSVKLAPNISGVNVRAEPSYTALIIADAIKPGTTYPVEAASGAFYKLCASGWVASRSQSGQALLVFTAAPPTPTATATLPPTATRVAATATPQATPTRIRHNFIWCVAGSVTQTAAGGQAFVECSAP